jgi:serine/threonine protein kinase
MDVVQTLGKYEIRGTLGKGAMGTVYDGWDPLIARRVAIKTVSLPAEPDPETAEEIARFRREAQAAGRLQHPNIVAVYDYGETNDIAYIVMEFVDGPSLKAPLDNHERFALPDIQRVMNDLLAGLQFSHDRGVVHRDIKPANIMMTSDGRAKIADFGIARIERSSMTQAGTVLGTPAYMSPEQFMGQVVDARTDVYSAGVLLYQLLTGERPFEGGLTAIMHKVLNTDPPAPSELAVTVPNALDAVVKRAMAKRPDDRYPSATAFAEAIRQAIAGAPSPVDDILGSGDDGAEATVIGRTHAAAAPARTAPAKPEPPSPGRAPAPPSRSKVPLFAGIGVAVVVILGGAGWFLLGGSSGPPATPSPSAPTAESAPSGSPSAQSAAQVSPPPQPSAAQPATSPQSVAAQPATPPPQSAPVQPAQPPTQPVSAQPVVPAPAGPPPTPPVPATATASNSVVASVSIPATATAASPIVTPAAPATGTPAATPPPIKEAAVEVGALGRQLTQALAQSSCALGNALVQDGGSVTVSGFASPQAAASLRDRIARVPGATLVDWRLQPIDPVFCSALTLLRPISSQAGAPISGLTVTLANGITTLHDGDRIMPRITMGDFPGELRVDYLGHDGSIVHLYPTVADPAQHVLARPSTRLAAGAPLSIGEAGPGRPIWVVGPPYGTDMIFAIASSTPLLPHPPPRNEEENAASYLRELTAAVARVRQAGGQVAGTLVLVDTLPKQ